MGDIRWRPSWGFFRLAHVAARRRQAELRQIQGRSLHLRFTILNILTQRGDTKIRRINFRKRGHVFITWGYLQAPC